MSPPAPSHNRKEEWGAQTTIPILPYPASRTIPLPRRIGRSQMFHHLGRTWRPLISIPKEILPPSPLKYPTQTVVGHTRHVYSSRSRQWFFLPILWPRQIPFSTSLRGYISWSLKALTNKALIFLLRVSFRLLL